MKWTQKTPKLKQQFVELEPTIPRGLDDCLNHYNRNITCIINCNVYLYSRIIQNNYYLKNFLQTWICNKGMLSCVIFRFLCLFYNHIHHYIVQCALSRC